MLACSYQVDDFSVVSVRSQSERRMFVRAVICGDVYEANVRTRDEGHRLINALEREGWRDMLVRYRDWRQQIRSMEAEDKYLVWQARQGRRSARG
jgi:hypothetical protein